MNVGHLIDFYKSQNQLAVQAAGQTAANKTQANIVDAQANMADKRAQQEQQLEHFRQLMENMRQARNLSSQEGMAVAKLEADAMQGGLGREFMGAQNAAEQQFRQGLAKFEMGGKESLLNKEIAANKEIAGMKIAAEAPAQAESAARAKLYEAQAETVNAPDIQGNIALLTKIAEQKDNLKKVLGGDKGVKDLTVMVTKQLTDAGVDTTNVPQLAEQQVPEIRAKAEALNKNLESDFETMKKQGAVQYIQQAQVELQYLVANGIIKDPAGAVLKLRQKMKELGVKESDL